MRRRDALKLGVSALAGLALGSFLGFQNPTQKVKTTTTLTQTLTKFLTYTETESNTLWRTITQIEVIPKTISTTVTETRVIEEHTTTTVLSTVSYPEHTLPMVGSWAYQLQDAEPDELAVSGFELVVVDYSRDGTDETAYSRDEIEMLKQRGVIPVAYLSIGEAEDYRFYWKKKWNINKPKWLGRENPEWPGNYKVKYWYDEWQRIVLRYLDKIINQGFSGVYLDLIDSFEYWSDWENNEDTTLPVYEAAGRMINFVAKIAHYARAVRGYAPFYVIPQNGESILDYDTHGIYLSTISAIGVEDLWYDGTTPNTSSYVNERLQYLNLITSAGKPVLSVDYVDDGTGYVGENRSRIDDYITKARSSGFIPYAARVDRELDRLVIIDEVQPPRELS